MNNKITEESVYPQLPPSPQLPFSHRITSQTRYVGDETSDATGNGGMGHSIAYYLAGTDEERLKARNIDLHDDGATCG